MNINYRIPDLEGFNKTNAFIGEGIVNLYNEMNDLVNKSGMYLNLEDDNGCLYFNVWNTHTWGEYTLYYFPVKFVEELNPTLRRIVITFYHNFMKENGITTINDEDDMDWAMDMLTEGCYEDEDAKERRAREKLVKSYKMVEHINSSTGCGESPITRTCRKP